MAFESSKDPSLCRRLWCQWGRDLCNCYKISLCLTILNGKQTFSVKTRNESSEDLLNFADAAPKDVHTKSQRSWYVKNSVTIITLNWDAWNKILTCRFGSGREKMLVISTNQEEFTFYSLFYQTTGKSLAEINQFQYQKYNSHWWMCLGSFQTIPFNSFHSQTIEFRSVFIVSLCLWLSLFSIMVSLIALYLKWRHLCSSDQGDTSFPRKLSRYFQTPLNESPIFMHFP